MAFFNRLSGYYHTGMPVLLITMVITAMHYFSAGEGMKGASHAVELGIVLQNRAGEIRYRQVIGISWRRPVFHPGFF